VHFFDIGHPCYDELTPVKTDVSDNQYYVAISLAQVLSSYFFLMLTADQELLFLLDLGVMSGLLVENKLGLFRRWIED